MIIFSDFTKLSDFSMRKCFEIPISLSKQLLFYLVSLDSVVFTMIQIFYFLPFNRRFETFFMQRRQC